MCDVDGGHGRVMVWPVNDGMGMGDGLRLGERTSA